MGNVMTRQDAEQVAGRPSVAPRVDVFENKDELLLLADLPGVAESELKIQLEKDELTIEAVAAEVAAGAPLAREFRRLAYRRSFVLPSGIDRERVGAELRDGVLWLHLPKSAAVKPRRIEVKAVS